MPEWFANYTTIVADALGDRVKDFITINEPQCIIGSGYALGVHAPGLKCCAADIVRAAHHLMLAHGRAVQVLRAHVPGVRRRLCPMRRPVRAVYEFARGHRRRPQGVFYRPY